MLASTVKGSTTRPLPQPATHVTASSSDAVSRRATSFMGRCDFDTTAPRYGREIPYRFILL
jgi:hypothetical protein